VGRLIVTLSSARDQIRSCYQLRKCKYRDMKIEVNTKGSDTKTLPKVVRNVLMVCHGDRSGK
jgi:hypothetical protein